MSYTDIIVVLSSIIFIQRGWAQGILRTILGPLTFVVGTLLGYFYYLATKNIFISVMISIFAPIVLGVAASTVFFLITRVNGGEAKSSTLSRALAAGLNLAWGELWLITMIMLVLMLPDNIVKITAIRNDIERSAALQMVSPLFTKLLNKNSKNPTTSLSLMSFNDPESAKKLQAMPEYQKIASDKAIQDVLNDPEIAALAEKKDFGKLMTHPKILKLTSDPELMKKFIALYPKLLKNN